MAAPTEPAPAMMHVQLVNLSSEHAALCKHSDMQAAQNAELPVRSAGQIALTLKPQLVAFRAFLSKDEP